MGFKSRTIVTLSARLREEIEALPLEERQPAIDHVRNEVRYLAPGRAEVHREALERLLSSTNGNVSAVARAIGKERIQIRRWCTRLGIEIDAFRER